MTNQVLIVSEQGPSIGLGHYSRSLSILRHLSGVEGLSVEMMVRGEERAFLADEVSSFFDIGDLRSKLEIKLADSKCKTVILLDCKSRDLMQLVVELRETNDSWIRVCVVDRWEYDTSLIDFWFIPSFFNRFTRASQPICDWRFGWDCLILPHHGRVGRKTKARRVFLSFGSSPHAELNGKILREVFKVIPRGWGIDLVMGEFTKVELPRHIRNLRVHRGLTDLRALQDEASVGFSIYGLTVFELFQSGVGVVTLSNYSELERAEVQDLYRLGLALVAESAEEVGRHLASLISQPGFRSAIACRARNAVRVSGLETLTDVVQRMYLTS